MEASPIRTLIALLLIAPAFVGCIGTDTTTPPATPPAEEPIAPMAERAGVDELPAELDRIVAVEIEAEDGTALRGHLYLPKGPGPFATILEFIPYWNQGGIGPSDGFATEEDGRRTMAGMYQHLMDQGYAVAFVNTRGTGLSDGCYSYMNHEKNGPDANAVVDALAAKPWSNGKVGMLGISYGGATQYAAVAHQPSEHLAAAVAMSGEWDEWNFLGEWGTGGTGALAHPSTRNVQQGLGVFAPLWGQAPTVTNWCEETIRDAAGWWELATNGDKTPFFEELDLREGLAENDVPFFYTFGLTDCDGAHKRQVWDLWGILPEDLDKRAMLGEWCHEYPTGETDWFVTEHALPWYDHHLRGGPAVDTGVVDYLDQQEVWHRAAAWPPAGNQTQLFLSDGTLVANQAASATSEHVLVNNDLSEPWVRGCEADDAIFVTPALARDVRLVGDAHLNVTMSSTAPDGNVQMTLYATDRAPTCENDLEVRELRHGRTDLHHRSHLFQGEDFPVNEPAPMHVRSLPFATTVEAGEHLVLAVSAGTDDALPAGYQPVLTIHTGEGTASFLTLNVVEGELVFDEGGGEEPGVSSSPAGLASIR